MSRYDDYSSSATLNSEPTRWDANRFSRERESRRRGPAVAERPRYADDRFESRLREADRYGPPARRPERYYEDEHLVRPAGPLVAHDRRRVEDPPPPRPGLLRRQSSLDTFDRIPTRKLDEFYSREYAPRAAPLRRPPRRRSPPYERHGREFYEDIRIAEPDYYGDDEYRDFFERDRRPRRLSRSREPPRVREEVEYEKPYPRKGKTRIPSRLVHPRAVIELGYPFLEENDTVILLKALSKEQIDEVITVSREIRRRTETRIRRTSPSPIRERPPERIVEHVDMYSPRSSHDTLVISPSPRRGSRSRSRHYRGVSETDLVRTVSRPRSISHRSRYRHPSSPMRIIERDDDWSDSDEIRAGPLAVVASPRSRSRSRSGSRDWNYELIRDTEITDGRGDREEITEVEKNRRGLHPRILRAMMATLT